MRSKYFNDYDKACRFNDKVDGQIQWGSNKDKQYWIVWYIDEEDEE